MHAIHSTGERKAQLILLLMLFIILSRMIISGSNNGMIFLMCSKTEGITLK